ncbi:hypothetical protein RKD55_001306 [Rossellomorea marisflavi]
MGRDRFIALRALAFHGEGVEPLFPLESSTLRSIPLFGGSSVCVLDPFECEGTTLSKRMESASAETFLVHLKDWGISENMDRSIALRALAFHGEEVEPPRQACGVSIIPLFPLESSALRSIPLFGGSIVCILVPFGCAVLPYGGNC